MSEENPINPLEAVNLAAEAVSLHSRSEQKRLILEFRRLGWLSDSETSLVIVFLGLGSA